MASAGALISFWVSLSKIFFLFPFAYGVVTGVSKSGFVYLSLFLESRVHGLQVGFWVGFLVWVVREC